MLYCDGLLEVALVYLAGFQFSFSFSSLRSLDGPNRLLHIRFYICKHGEREQALRLNGLLSLP